MNDVKLTADQHAKTQEEKTWVINTLLKRLVAIGNDKPVEAITHDIKLGLIGDRGQFVKVTRFDEMTKLFSEMKISNIHIQHINCRATDEENDQSVGDKTSDAGPYAFLLSDALSWFLQELPEYNDSEKLRQVQSLGMFLVFMVKTSFMENFEGGVALANWFLGILSDLPGLEHVAETLCRPPAINMLSSAEVARHMFRYFAGQVEMPEDEIAIMLTRGDGVLNGLEGVVEHFKANPDGDNSVGVSCHFVPYISTEELPKGLVRLSDLIVTVATLLPAPGVAYDDVTDNMMGLLFHVCNSNLKGVPRIDPSELQARLAACKCHIAAQKGKA